MVRVFLKCTSLRKPGYKFDKKQVSDLIISGGTAGLDILVRSIDHSLKRD